MLVHPSNNKRWALTAALVETPNRRALQHVPAQYVSMTASRDHASCKAKLPMFYRLFFKIDLGDEWAAPPFKDKDLCFRKPHLSDPKASEQELRAATAAMWA